MIDVRSHGSIWRLNKLEERTLETKTSISNSNSNGPLVICFEITQQISLKQSASHMLSDVPEWQLPESGQLRLTISRFSDSGENWNMMSLSCLFPQRVRYRVPWEKGREDQKYPSITSGPSVHGAVRMIGEENYWRNNSECVRLSHPKSLLTHILHRCGCIREPVKAINFRLLAPHPGCWSSEVLEFRLATGLSRQSILRNDTGLNLPSRHICHGCWEWLSAAQTLARPCQSQERQSRSIQKKKGW